MAGEVVPTPAPPETVANRRKRWGAGAVEALPTLFVLALLGLLISLKEPSFCSARNIANVVTRSVPLALIALGETVVIISGQIDLSVGSVMAVAAVISALVLQSAGAAAVGWAVLAGVAAAGLCGWVNGWVTCKARIPSFIVTLAMMGLARGLALLLSKSQTVGGAFALRDLVLLQVVPLHQPGGAGVTLPVLILFLVAVAVHVLLAQTSTGRNAYAIGANPVAARLSGVRVDRQVVLAFVLCGLLTGVAGVVECGRNTSAQPDMGQLKELDAIAAVVIGGASLAGGQGSVAGSVLGVAIMAVLHNGCNLLGFKNEWEKVAIGPLIVLAVLYDRWHRRRRRERR